MYYLGLQFLGLHLLFVCVCLITSFKDRTISEIFIHGSLLFVCPSKLKYLRLTEYFAHFVYFGLRYSSKLSQNKTTKKYFVVRSSLNCNLNSMEKTLY